MDTLAIGIPVRAVDVKAGTWPRHSAEWIAADKARTAELIARSATNVATVLATVETKSPRDMTDDELLAELRAPVDDTMDAIAAWDATEEGKAWRAENDPRNAAKAPDVLPADHPRMKGFNYGAGWSAVAKTELYQKCEAVALRIRAAHAEIGRQNFAAITVLRNATLAETQGERDKAIAALEAWYAANDPRDSKGDPTPNYSFAQLAAIDFTTLTDSEMEKARELLPVIASEGWRRVVAADVMARELATAANLLDIGDDYHTTEQVDEAKRIVKTYGTEREARATDPELIYGETI